MHPTIHQANQAQLSWWCIVVWVRARVCILQCCLGSVGASVAFLVASKFHTTICNEDEGFVGVHCCLIFLLALVKLELVLHFFVACNFHTTTCNQEAGFVGVVWCLSSKLNFLFYHTSNNSPSQSGLVVMMVYCCSSSGKNMYFQCCLGSVGASVAFFIGIKFHTTICNEDESYFLLALNCIELAITFICIDSFLSILYFFCCFEVCFKFILRLSVL